MKYIEPDFANILLTSPRENGTYSVVGQLHYCTFIDENNWEHFWVRGWHLKEQINFISDLAIDVSETLFKEDLNLIGERLNCHWEIIRCSAFDH